LCPLSFFLACFSDFSLSLSSFFLLSSSLLSSSSSSISKKGFFPIPVILAEYERTGFPEFPEFPEEDVVE
jgi:hypothetical protein